MLCSLGEVIPLLLCNDFLYPWQFYFLWNWFCLKLIWYFPLNFLSELTLHVFLCPFIFNLRVFLYWYFLHSPVSKESACNEGDPGLIPGSGRSPGEGKGNTLQYSCLENPMDRGAWQATVYAVVRVRHDWATKHTAHIFIF